MDGSEYPLGDKEFDRLRRLVRDWAGISLVDSKRQMVQARLQKTLRALKLPCFAEYCGLLESAGPSSEEATGFINSITTNKTDFFREPHHFEFVKSKLVPRWVSDSLTGSQTLRIWHAGCSTGEEPYSMAMTLLEAFRTRPLWDIRLLATDIDTNVLEFAQKGVYENERVQPVPPDYLKRFFLRGKGEMHGFVKVKPEVSDLVTFKKLNLLDEPWPFRPECRFDAIFCRNVVIYFDQPTQRKVFERLGGMLRPGGHLFVGHSESLFRLSHVLVAVGGTIYQRLSRDEEDAA
jgi:chemotaxis protein methyltransferase CheR